MINLLKKILSQENSVTVTERTNDRPYKSKEVIYEVLNQDMIFIKLFSVTKLSYTLPKVLSSKISKMKYVYFTGFTVKVLQYYLFYLRMTIYI